MLIKRVLPIRRAASANIYLNDNVFRNDHPNSKHISGPISLHSDMSTIFCANIMAAPIANVACTFSGFTPIPDN